MEKLNLEHCRHCGELPKYVSVDSLFGPYYGVNLNDGRMLWACPKCGMKSVGPGWQALSVTRGYAHQAAVWNKTQKSRPKLILCNNLTTTEYIEHKSIIVYHSKRYGEKVVFKSVTPEVLWQLYRVCTEAETEYDVDLELLKDLEWTYKNDDNGPDRYVLLTSDGQFRAEIPLNGFIEYDWSGKTKYDYRQEMADAGEPYDDQDLDIVGICIAIDEALKKLKNNEERNTNNITRET